jgi:hypothetical protein
MPATPVEQDKPKNTSRYICWSDPPVRAALFTHHFETAFVVGYQHHVEGARPDVAWAHIPFAPNPSYATRLRMARPELAAVLDLLVDRFLCRNSPAYVRAAREPLQAAFR